MEDKIILGLSGGGQSSYSWTVNSSHFSEDLDAAFYFVKNSAQTRTGKFEWTDNGFQIGSYVITYDENNKFSFIDNNSDETLSATKAFQAIVRVGNYLYCIGSRNIREALLTLDDAMYEAGLYDD